MSDVLVIEAPNGIRRGGVKKDTRYIVSHAEGTLGPSEFIRRAYMCGHVMHACAFRRCVFYSLAEYHSVDWISLFGSSFGGPARAARPLYPSDKSVCHFIW